MRSFSAVLIALGFSGCQSCMRTVIGPNDFFYHAEISYMGNRDFAFHKALFSTIRIYGDIRHIVEHNDPKAWLLILRPRVMYQVGGASGTNHVSPYELRIRVHDTKVVMECILDRDFRGDWPPQDQIPLIKQKFRAIALKIAADLGGTITNERNYPKESEDFFARSVLRPDT